MEIRVSEQLKQCRNCKKYQPYGVGHQNWICSITFKYPVDQNGQCEKFEPRKPGTELAQKYKTNKND